MVSFAVTYVLQGPSSSSHFCAPVQVALSPESRDVEGLGRRMGLSRVRRCRRLALSPGFFLSVNTQLQAASSVAPHRRACPLQLTLLRVTGRFSFEQAPRAVSEACGFLPRISPGLGHLRRRSRQTPCQAARTPPGPAVPPSCHPPPRAALSSPGLC